MVDQDILRQIENKLNLRWPHRSFSVLADLVEGINIIFDTFATESEEKQIRKYVEKFMGLEFPNFQYTVDRLPF